MMVWSAELSRHVWIVVNFHNSAGDISMIYGRSRYIRNACIIRELPQYTMMIILWHGIYVDW